MSKQEDIDKASDQAATQASALTISWLREHLKKELEAALKDIYWQLWRDLFYYLYKANWFRLLAGLLTLASAITLWVRDK